MPHTLYGISFLTCELRVSLPQRNKCSSRIIFCVSQPVFFHGLARWIGSAKNNRYGILAVSIPLIIRSLPEIIVGPYPVGFDTIAFYVPNTIDWATGKVGFGLALGTGPLLYLIALFATYSLRMQPVWVFKFMGPILYGCLMFSIYQFLRLGLRWSEKLSLSTVFLSSLYFVTLRISWDLFRTMLGLTFIFISLPFLGNLRTPRSYLMVLLLSVLAILSDQFAATIMLSILLYRAATLFFRKRNSEFTKILRIVLPSLSLFSVIAFLDVSLGLAFIHDQLPLQTSAEALEGMEFLAYCYAPLTPLVFLGYRRVKNLDLKVWSFACVLGAVSVLIPFMGLIVSFRWSLLLDFPLCVYAASGISAFRNISIRNPFLAHTINRILATAALLLTLSSCLYVALPAERALPYFNSFPSLMPTSLAQSSIPASDMPALTALLRWVRSNSNNQTFLITHQAIYGWARAYGLAASRHLIDYGYSSPMTGVAAALESGATTVLVIWWANGQGWHDQTSLPSGFVPILTAGSLVLYKYSFSQVADGRQ